MSEFYQLMALLSLVACVITAIVGVAMLLKMTDQKNQPAKGPRMSYADYRSTAYSILKTQFGWTGFAPSAEVQKEVERIIETCQQGPSEAANNAAILLASSAPVGALFFGPRIDGLPNKRIVVDGCVFYRADSE